MAKSLFDKTLQEATLFELFKPDSVSNTEKALRLAMQAITERIMKTSGSWTKRELTRIKAMIAQEIINSYSGLSEALALEMASAANISYANMMGTATAVLPVSVINDVTSPTRLVQGYSMKDLFKATSENHARQLQVILGSGVSRGVSNEQIVREMLGKNTKLTRNQLRNASFTAVTEAREQARHSAFSMLEAQGLVDGYEYVAVLDANTTDYCREHDGKKYYQPIDEITNLIKVHFHCRSVFTAINDYTVDDDEN